MKAPDFNRKANPDNVVEFKPPSSSALPPCSLEYERSILAMIIQNPYTGVGYVSHILEPRHFYPTPHQEIFSAALHLTNNGIPTDPINIITHLEKQSLLARCGGSHAILDFLDVYPPTQPEYCATEIYRYWQRRCLIEAAQSVIDAASDLALEHDEVNDQAEQKIFAVTQTNENAGFISPSVGIGKTNNLTTELTEGSGTHFVSSGFPSLDEMLTGEGFGENQLVIIGADSSQGKSTLAGNIASNLASAGWGVGIFTLEMTEEQYRQRIISAEAKIELFKMSRKKGMSLDEIVRYRAESERQKKLPLFICDNPDLTLVGICSKARRLKSDLAKQGIQLKAIVLDYLTLLPEIKEAFDERKAISRTTRALKRLAGELGITVFCLSQLSREVAKGSKRPTKHHLFGAGSIDQDSDIILLIYREGMYNPEVDQSATEIIVDKQRNGSLGSVRISYIPEILKFHEPHRTVERPTPKQPQATEVPTPEESDCDEEDNGFPDDF